MKALSALTQLGLSVWTQVEEVDQELYKIADKDKRHVVLAQINVQKFVLLSKGRRQLFQQTNTVNGKKQPVLNLKEIIALNPELSDEPQQSSTTTRQDIQPKVLEQNKQLMKKVQRSKKQTDNSQVSYSRSAWDKLFLLHQCEAKAGEFFLVRVLCLIKLIVFSYIL